MWPFFVALNLSYFLCYFTPSLPSMCTPIRRIDSSSRLSIVKKDFGSSSSKIEITTLQHVYARQEAVDFWIAGKILGVESLEEWYYVSCKRIGCNKKLETQNGQLYCHKIHNTISQCIGELPTKFDASNSITIVIVLL
nr:replication protein A 70 kDa DNA-binding subunit B-like [Ipomoea batatas]